MTTTLPRSSRIASLGFGKLINALFPPFLFVGVALAVWQVLCSLVQSQRCLARSR